MPVVRPKPLSMGEELLSIQIRALKLPEPEREYKFCHNRQWRFDFCWHNDKFGLAVEIDGGNSMAKIASNGKAFAIGRHTKDADYQKTNAAVLMGWRVLRFTPAMVKSGEAIQLIENILMEAMSCGNS